MLAIAKLLAEQLYDREHEVLLTVYGPPPADAERIEAVEAEGENCIREETRKPGAHKLEQLLIKENVSSLQMLGTAQAVIVGIKD